LWQSWVGLLFNLSFLEQDPLSHDGIKLDQANLFDRAAHILARGIKEPRPGRAGQLDGHRLAAAAGHLQCHGGVHGAVTVCWLSLSSQRYNVPRRAARRIE